MLSTCWLIGAYFLADSSHKRGRLNTSVYGMSPKKFGPPNIKHLPTPLLLIISKVSLTQ